MDITQFTFTDSAANIAVGDLIARTKLFKDSNNKLVFGNRVTRGIGLGEEPTFSNCPAVRFWIDFATLQNNSNLFAPKNSLYTVSAYLYYYTSKKDSNRAVIDMQLYKTALCEAYIRHLWAPSSDNANGFIPRNGEQDSAISEGKFIWDFANEQDVSIDHTSVFKRINQNIILKEPFGASRIDFDIKCFIHV